jgi:hypothetical protein
MFNKLRGFWAEGNTTLLLVGSAISGIAVWLVVEAVLAIRSYSRRPAEQSLDVALPDR